MRVAFLARHGPGHVLLPSEVPAKANIAALKSLGVQAILAFSAVGSLQEHIRPEDFVLPTQIIDRTRGRDSTFFGEGIVAHVPFGDPFDPQLHRILTQCHPALERGVRLHSDETEKGDLTVICMEGPAFSTRAESHMYRSWGGSVINMSVLPEAKLAREAEIAYQMICMSTDYDCWNESEEHVTVELVLSHVANNTENAGRLLLDAVRLLEPELRAGNIGKSLRGSVSGGLTTHPSYRLLNKRTADKIKFILPDAF